MLTARSVVITTIVIAVVSILAACISLLQPPDSGGLGRDSYGTRAQGFRAIFETLEELQVPVERGLVPPTAVLDEPVTFVLWRPHPNLVALEPAYLGEIAAWVREGGRVVVAPISEEAWAERWPLAMLEYDEEGRDSVLQGLGLPDVYVDTVDLIEPDPSDPESDEQPRDDDELEGFGEFREELSEALAAEPVPSRTVRVKAVGELVQLGDAVSTLTVPEVGLQVLDLLEDEPEGRLAFTTEEGDEHTLVAQYRVGQGELLVVSEPALLENRFLATADNAVLAVHLLAADGRPVLFDEFYHGLTIRGNPLWLLTRESYACTALVVLLVVGFWVWRQAVSLGPPLAPSEPSRRSLGEYVEAMARFFQRGRRSRQFVLREVRDGVLWTLRNDLGLAPGREHVDDVAAVLARRSPLQAEQLVEAVHRVDLQLEKGPRSGDRETVQSLERISGCL